MTQKEFIAELELEALLAQEENPDEYKEELEEEREGDEDRRLEDGVIESD